MDFIETQLETAARAVASLEAQVNQEEEGEVKGGDLSDQESLSVCHLGCAGPTMNGLVTKTDRMKGGVTSPESPKIQALPEWGGGSDPCLDFCEGFVHMH